MSKKKPEPTPTPTPTETSNVMVKLPAEIHRRLRIHCINMGTTMQEYLETIITESLG